MTERKKRQKRKKRRRVLSVFPMLYPSQMGTPLGYRPGSGNDSGGSSEPSPSPPPSSGGMGESGFRPTRARVLHEMRRALGLTIGRDRANMGGDAFPRGPQFRLVRTVLAEYFNDAPNVAMGGFSLPTFAATPMRTGGPVIGGPGFQHDGHGEGGKYDFKKSPGLGFRTEAAWRIWEKAMEVIDKEKNLPKHSILLRAMSKAGVHRGQMDPAEYRLLEMGIEWYMSTAGASGANRSVFY
ncbi:MAG TPA: hypothetical protein VMY18_11790 [Acidobacteriota bacterium]|nr:hypothetical protein [Acidobacteriota bacterium]